MANIIFFVVIPLLGVVLLFTSRSKKSFSNLEKNLGSDAAKKARLKLLVGGIILLAISMLRFLLVLFLKVFSSEIAV